MSAPRRHAAHGFAYVWLLFFIAAMGAGLAAGGVVWEQRQRREKEADLLFIGAEMRRAIRNYYLATPEAAKQAPLRLEDLVEDRRGPVTRRHLRRIYADPLTGRADWGLVRQQGRITGVYSLARGVPLRQGAFREEDREFAGARRYADWRFVAPGVVPAPAVPAARVPGFGAAVGAARPLAGTAPASPAIPAPPAEAGIATPDAAPVSDPASGAAGEVPPAPAPGGAG